MATDGWSRCSRGLAEPDRDAADGVALAEVDVRLRYGAVEVLIGELVMDEWWRRLVDLQPEAAARLGRNGATEVRADR